jgi:hypothetical protein
MTTAKGKTRTQRAANNVQFRLSIDAGLLQRVKHRAHSLGLDVNQYLSGLATQDVAKGGEFRLLPAATTSIAMPSSSGFTVVRPGEPAYSVRMAEEEEALKRWFQAIRTSPALADAFGRASRLGEEGMLELLQMIELQLKGVRTFKGLGATSSPEKRPKEELGPVKK